jgi:hypothetical protein
LNFSMSMETRGGITSNIAVSTRTMQPQKPMHFYQTISHTPDTMTSMTQSTTTTLHQ